MKLAIRLSKSFGAFSLELDQSVTARCLGVLGASGSGKTTLFNCITGLVRPFSGRIDLDGRVLFERDSGRSLPVHQRGIGYVFQDALLFPHISVAKNLRYGAGAHGHGPPLEDVVRILELKELLERYPATLSGGQARRVAIGRALLTGPRLLLLDEPLSGLDRAMSVRTLEYIRRVIEAFSIPTIYVSHAFSDVRYLCDVAWILKEGRLVASGTPTALLNSTGTLINLEDDDLCTFMPAERIASIQGASNSYRVGQQEIYCPAGDKGIHSSAVLCLRADDIIIARERPSRISARNILTAQVASVHEGERSVLVHLKTDSCSDLWLARLTPSAVRELQLVPQTPVFMIIKASSIGVVPMTTR